MACKRTYYGNDLQPSQTFETLKDQFGEARAEELYLRSKQINFSESEINKQGDATPEAIIEKVVTEPIAKSKPSIVEIYNNLLSSRNPLEDGYRDVEHEYYLNDKKLESVSEFTDRHVPYTGSKTEFAYDQEGTKYHGALEDIINGKLTNEEIVIGRGLNEAEAALVPYLRSFVAKLNQTGKVIPELKVALADKGIAGTVDIVHIKKNGKVDIYDLKAAFQTPNRKKRGEDAWDVYAYDNYKARRYALQTTYYKHILENSDSATGRQGVEVDNVFVLPFEVLMNDDNNVTEGIITMSPENIVSWTKGKFNPAATSEKIVQSVIGDVGITDSEIKGYESHSTTPTFLSQVLPKEPLSEDEIQRKARRILENPNNKEGFEIRNTFYRWKGKSKEDKLARIKDVITLQDDKAGADVARSAILTSEGARSGIFEDPDSKASIQLDAITKEARAVETFLLSSIDGFESHDDIVVFKRKDGSVDLVKMSFEDTQRVLPILNPSKNFARKTILHETGSIVGNYMTLAHAKQNGIKLQNNIGDREKLRMAITAMELKKSNPDLKVNRVLVQSFLGGEVTIPRSVDMSDLLPQVKAIYNIPEIKGTVTGRLKTILDDESLYQADEIDVDPVMQYLNWIRNNLNEKDFLIEGTDKKNVRYWNMKALEATVRGELRKDQLIEKLIANEKGLQSIIRNKYHGTLEQTRANVIGDPEYMQMARTVITLKDGKLSPEEDVSEGALGNIMKFLVTPTKTGRQTLDKALDEFRKGLDAVKNSITQYNQDKRPVLEALRDTDPVWKAGLKISGRNVVSTDTILGMGQSIFEPLFQTRTTADGVKYKVPYLISEESAEFSKLKPAQQRFIKWFNDQAEKWYNQSHPFTDKNGVRVYKWTRGMIPILTASPNTSLYKAKSNIVKGEGKNVLTSLKNFLTRTFDIMGNYGNFRSPDKSNDRDHIYDFFSRQLNQTDGSISSRSLEAIGLDPEMNLIDSKKNLQFETDLEEVMNQFMAHNVKKREMDKKLPLGRMYQSIFKYYHQAHFLKQSDSIRLLDNFVNDNIFGEKIGADSAVTKVLNISVGTSSLMLLGLNWKVFTANGMQMGLSSLMQTMATQFSGDKRFPGFKANTKAFKELAKMSNPAEGFDQARKIDMLLELYMPEDITQLKTRRYKVSQKGIIDSQTAFAIDRIIERGLRAHYLVAQMIQDGTYDAHSVERYEGADGLTRYRIKYDERKDSRFKDDPELKTTIQEALKGNGEMDTEEELLTKAYDWRLRQKYKSYADQMFSSFDKDLKSDYAHYGLFAGFSQFRSWYRDKLVKATKREYDSMVTGDYVQTESGHVWSNEEFKGVLWTLADLGSIAKDVIKDKGFKNVSRTDQQNLLLAGNSVSAWALLALLVTTAFDDEDDPTSVMAQAVLMRGIQDLHTIVTLAPVFGILADPFIFASYYSGLLDRFVSMSSALTRGDTEEAVDDLINATPVIKDFKDFV